MEESHHELLIVKEQQKACSKDPVFP